MSFSERLENKNLSNSPFAEKLRGDKLEFIRKAKDRNCYGYTFDQSNGRHPISMALDFFTSDGNRFGVFYMEVASPILFSLGSNGKPQTITMRIGRNIVEISGKNLSVVYEYILEQRLVWVKENSSSFVQDGGDEPMIEKIELKDSP
jgi:hypothetical protein